MNSFSVTAGSPLAPARPALDGRPLRLRFIPLSLRSRARGAGRPRTGGGCAGPAAGPPAPPGCGPERPGTPGNSSSAARRGRWARGRSRTSCGCQGLSAWGASGACWASQRSSRSMRTSGGASSPRRTAPREKPTTVIHTSPRGVRMSSFSPRFRDRASMLPPCHFALDLLQQEGAHLVAGRLVVEIEEMAAGSHLVEAPVAIETGGGKQPLDDGDGARGRLVEALPAGEGDRAGALDGPAPEPRQGQGLLGGALEQARVIVAQGRG